MHRSFALAKDGKAVPALVGAIGASLASAGTADPVAGPPRCAATVVSYAAGSGAGASYQQPSSALGEPTRLTGAGVEPGAVTPFRPAFMPNEVVSVGRGGHLVVAFNDPVLDDPRNPHGIDLIVYGNSFCSDLAYPAGVTGWLYSEGGTIELSSDGLSWSPVPAAEADGGLPTLAFADVTPYATGPGDAPTAVDVPVDPAVSAESLVGMPWPELVKAYGGAAGGTRIDIAATGLGSARFVRIAVAADAAYVPEVDAVVAVRPAPPDPDIDGNGSVDGADLGILLGDWGPCPRCPTDLDENGTVSGADLGLMLGAWS